MRGTRPNPPTDSSDRESLARQLPIDRLFGVGEDVTGWAIPWMRIGRLRLRLHVITLAWIAAELLAWLPHDAVGLVHVTAACASLLMLATAREAIRLGIAQRLGADADQATVFPLGGLTPMVTPRPSARGLLLETGGLWASVIFVPLAAAGVVLSGLDPHSLMFDPTSPRVIAATLRTPWQIVAWWSYASSVVLLASNLLPAEPFDAGRLLRAVLARHAGHRGPVIAARIGLTSTSLLFVVSAAAGEARGMTIALFASLVTYLEFRRSEFRHDAGGPHLPSLRESAGPAPEVLPAPTLDAVLAKISASGLESLSLAEREVLAAETARRNRG